MALGAAEEAIRRIRGGLADRITQADRGPRARRARRRPGRGAGAGCAGGGARAVAGGGRPGQPGRLADGHGQAPRPRPAPPRQAAARASIRSSGASWTRAGAPRAGAASALAASSTTTSGTTCCAWSSPPATRCSRADARVALTLRLLGGLTTDEIARAFLAPEPTIAQRIVRAKKTLAEAQVPFEVPRGGERAARLASVLEVIYLIFNEGYSATAGDDWMRPALCEDALRLGRILAGLAPDEPEVHGLVALMEIQASRARRAHRARGRADPAARAGPRALGPAADPPRAGGAGRAPRRSAARAAPTRCRPRIAACHARARTAADTDWARIAALYDALAQVAPSPVVELNRAVALAMAVRPRRRAGAGRRPRRPIRRSANYHLLAERARRLPVPSSARFDEARAEFERAAALTQNARERALLLARAAACGEAAGSSRATARRRRSPTAAPEVRSLARFSGRDRRRCAAAGGRWRGWRRFRTACRCRPRGCTSSPAAGR